jgi:hypothetical protein
MPSEPEGDRPLRRFAVPVLVLAGLCAATLGSPTRPERATAAARTPAIEQPDATILRQIDRYRRTTWRWQRVMSARPTASSRGPHRTPSLAYKRWVRNLWHGRAVKARRKAQHPPHRAALLCIHRYEGGWHDGGAPYYGGLQMDIAFQRTYARELFGRKGTADRWTPLEQIWAAEKALRAGRGYWPWPNSARLCGLL